MTYTHRTTRCPACSGHGITEEVAPGSVIISTCWACKGKRTQESFLARLACDQPLVD